MRQEMIIVKRSCGDVAGRLLDPAPKVEVAVQPQRDSLMRLFDSLMAPLNTLFGPNKFPVLSRREFLSNSLE
jgi:hypothetical protein